MRDLSLADIQGNIVRAYGGYGYPVARYFCLHIHQPEAGRRFVQAIRPHVTTAERWAKGDRTYSGADAIPRPDVTVNIAFSFPGLIRLELPTRSLRMLPDEFIEGMPRRADIIGDVGPSGIPHWDPVWRDNMKADDVGPRDHPGAVHVWMSLSARADHNGEPVPELERSTQWIRDLCRDSDGGVELLDGHGPDGADFQSAAALMVERDGRMVATSKEHFGFSDGIGNPVFEGQFEPDVEAKRVPGRGKLMPDQTWKPLATGEFILGHPDESQEIPTAPPPAALTRNGTFMVFRKLHQNVAGFHDYIQRMAERYAAIMRVDTDEASETLRAKMVGRWSDGVPLLAAPTYGKWQAFREPWAERTGPEDRLAYARALIDFKYGEDRDGSSCPLAAHIRRVNTRDMLDPTLAHGNQGTRLNGSALNKRRRILRRGLPYGSFDRAASNDDGDHGIIFIAMCASIFRQFEFVQQQWIHYGLDFNAGSDGCPILGNHSAESKYVIPPDPDSNHPPFICDELPQFLAVRGGDYFFVPGMSALRMIAMGVVDPT